LKYGTFFEKIYNVPVVKMQLRQLYHENSADYTEIRKIINYDMEGKCCGLIYILRRIL